MHVLTAIWFSGGPVFESIRSASFTNTHLPHPFERLGRRQTHKIDAACPNKECTYSDQGVKNWARGRTAALMVELCQGKTL